MSKVNKTALATRTIRDAYPPADNSRQYVAAPRQRSCVSIFDIFRCCQPESGIHPTSRIGARLYEPQAVGLRMQKPIKVLEKMRSDLADLSNVRLERRGNEVTVKTVTNAEKNAHAVKTGKSVRYLGRGPEKVKKESPSKKLSLIGQRPSPLGNAQRTEILSNNIKLHKLSNIVKASSGRPDSVGNLLAALRRYRESATAYPQYSLLRPYYESVFSDLFKETRKVANPDDRADALIALIRCADSLYPRLGAVRLKYRLFERLMREVTNLPDWSHWTRGRLALASLIPTMSAEDRVLARSALKKSIDRQKTWGEGLIKKSQELADLKAAEERERKETKKIAFGIEAMDKGERGESHPPSDAQEYIEILSSSEKPVENIRSVDNRTSEELYAETKKLISDLDSVLIENEAAIDLLILAGEAGDVTTTVEERTEKLEAAFRGMEIVNRAEQLTYMLSLIAWAFSELVDSDPPLKEVTTIRSYTKIIDYAKHLPAHDQLNFLCIFTRRRLSGLRPLKSIERQSIYSEVFSMLENHLLSYPHATATVLLNLCRARALSGNPALRERYRALVLRLPSVCQYGLRYRLLP